MIQGIAGVLIGVVVVVPLLVILAHAWPYFRRRIGLEPEVLKRLQTLAKQSLETMDVPVGAVLLYDGKIIGEGCNTVLRDRAAGGHAEINAMTSAIGAMGVERFAALDRKRLVLVSTFEPCLMCAGACVNYSIRNVCFLEAKGSAYLLRERLLYARVLVRRLRLRNRGEQRALFDLHPQYPRRARS